jgi:hypothetical protein
MDLSNHKHPPSYAAVVSADVVRDVVSKTIREQQKVNTDNCCLVVHGFPEEGNDYHQLMDMFDFLGARVTLFVIQDRLPQQQQQRRTPHKVELSFASDASEILKRAKLLQYSDYYASTYVNKWVPDDVMKLRRRQCDALNQANPARKDGRKQFVDRIGRSNAT